MYFCNDSFAEGIYLVGDTRPVYHCKFALVSSHECDYCICNDCYETKRREEKKVRESKKERSTRLSRMKRKRNDMYDDDDHDENVHEQSGNYCFKSKVLGQKCLKGDHEVGKLKVCCDAAYFANDYVKKKLIDKAGAYPKSCNECGKSFIDWGWM